MLYLDRPVFEFPINWADALNKAFVYDLNELSLGYGAEIFTSLQLHTTQGFQFSLDLTTEGQLDAFDDFFSALTGRLVGFWLPSPFEAMQVVAGISSTQFTIQDQKLVDSWQDHSSIYLFFVREGFVSKGAKITAVVALGGGLERVTIDTALADWANLFTPAAGVFKLHYVRLSSDVEQGKFVAEGWMKRSVRVIELPTEYTTIETGEKKIFLFHFWCAAPMDYHWRYTNFAADVVSGNKLFSKLAIECGGLKRGMKADSEGVQITTAYDANCPFALFLPIPFSRPMNVEVFETTFGDPDTTAALFTGRVRVVEDRGESLQGNCDSWAAILNRKTPRMLYQKECNNYLFDPATCRALRAHFETTGLFHTVASTSSTVVLTLDFPTDKRKVANYFAQGFLETGAGINFEVRTILSSSWNAGTSRLTITINAPLYHAAAAAPLQLIPGCDGSVTTCREKFNNFGNFGGFVDIPVDNLSLKAVEAKVSQGDKK